MKTSYKFILTSTLLLIMLIFLSCSVNDPTHSNGRKATYSAKQSGCNMILAKGDYNDSSFTYSFYDTLKVDFGIWGNCCPDSNRFVTNCKLKTDTIFVTVKDTADNGCLCNCPYIIHLEISDLTRDKYLFYMSYPMQYSREDSLEYREIVFKRY